MVFRQLILSGKDIESAYWELVIKDIQDACKLFEHIYDQTDAADGYVSVEVSPRLANDTDGTVEAAKWLHKMVNRPNVYIKIPATAECVPSIKQVISLGISVNVTVCSGFFFLDFSKLLIYTCYHKHQLCHEIFIFMKFSFYASSSRWTTFPIMV